MMDNNKVLHWSYRDFRCFPKSILNYRDCVEEIYLKENFITSIPLWVFEIVNLTFIHLAGNEINFIPEEIAFLKNLQFFDISENLIKDLPKSIGELKNLKVLNISKNVIEVLPRELGGLESLEVFCAGQNLISRIPDELGDCKKLVELSLDDNIMINTIPAKIFALMHLKIVRIDRCSIYHLPYTKCVTLMSLRVFENYFLTHIPYYYESFITEEYSHQSSFNLTDPIPDDSLIQIETEKEKRILVLPHQITTIHSNDSRNPLSLFELSLSAAHQYVGYNVIDGWLPSSITNILKIGPIARCGGAFCNIYIFKECYLLLLRRNQLRNDHVIISHLFCSKECLDKWFDDKSCFYRKIEWKYIF